jgi:Mlc titration factor MtfA (ptsG expression regulator)
MWHSAKERVFMSLWQVIKGWFGFKPPLEDLDWPAEWSLILEEHVQFYKRLNAEDRERFEQCCAGFLVTTPVEGGVEVVVDDLDRLLVASSAVIPVWGFPDWPFLNVKAVFLLPGSFNDRFECGRADSAISGMVGHGPMSGKMALSKPHLRLGFANNKDKQNVGIHEFVHILDMMDGRCDGFPERIRDFECCAPWFEFVRYKVAQVEKGKTNINRYGATNPAEFFAVSSEYFFERPAMLKKKHPQLYTYLSEFYQQNLAEIAEQNQSGIKRKSKKRRS